MESDCAGLDHNARLLANADEGVGRAAINSLICSLEMPATRLADALQRAFDSAGSSMVVVDGLDETAAGF